MPNIITKIVKNFQIVESKTQLKSYAVWGACSSCMKEALCLLFDKNCNNIALNNNETYRLCPTCEAQTPTKLKALKNLALEDMPLYINDSNILVRVHAAERLKKGK